MSDSKIDDMDLETLLTLTECYNCTEIFPKSELVIDLCPLCHKYFNNMLDKLMKPYPEALRPFDDDE